MDKIRKLIRWIWVSKERMVLVVMVGILCWKVYNVVNPPPVTREGFAVHTYPRAEVPAEGIFPPPPSLPERTAGEPLRGLTPFWIYANPGQAARQDTTVEDPGVALLAIMPWRDGSYRAQIRSTNTTKWYPQGAEFEAYRLESIDPNAGTVVIYSERDRKQRTLSIQ